MKFSSPMARIPPHVCAAAVAALFFAASAAAQPPSPSGPGGSGDASPGSEAPPGAEADPAGSAAPTPEDALAAEALAERTRRIERLIEALGGDDDRARGAARQALLEIGPEALPFLEEHFRRGGLLDHARLLEELVRRGAGGGPFNPAALERNLPPPEASAGEAASLPEQDKVTRAGYLRSVEQYRKGDYAPALAAVNALLVLYPRAPLRPQLQELRMLCDHRLLHTQVLAAEIVPVRDAFRLGDAVEFHLRVRNVSPATIRLEFGAAPEAPGARGQAIAEIQAAMLDPLGRRVILRRPAEWEVPAQIVVAPGGQWEQRVAVSTAEDDAELDDPTLLRVYEVGVKLFAARLWVGDRLEQRRIQFEAGVARVFPAGAKWRAEDPLANLGLTLDAEKATLNELFLAAMRVPPRDAPKAAPLLIRAIPRFRDEGLAVLLVSLGELTGQPFGMDVEKWLKWGRGPAAMPNAQTSSIPKPAPGGAPPKPGPEGR